MRIFSKFHDYYDIVMGHGSDPSRIYQRNQEEKTISETEFSLIGNSGYYSERFNFFQYDARRDKRGKFGRTNVLTSGIIGFAGKLYPYTIHSDCFVRDEYQETIRNYFYTEKETIDFMEKSENWDYDNDWTKTQSKKSVKDWFNNDNIKDFGKIFEKFNVPIFHIMSYGYGDYNLTLNPKLKEYKFQSVINPYLAFQELEMFLSSGVIGQKKELINISDSDMIHKKGFDKWSFKNPINTKTRKMKK